ncbi:MAG: matrixin family metalloprotease [Candidatus Nitrosotenuis sp.]|nr:MAG: matrixin family metalloprotease [Candidatus Nitrosotenuis sp.]
MGESAKVESENLKRLANIASVNIKNIEKIELDNAQHYAEVVSENLQRTTVIKAENLKESAKVSAENLRRSAQMHSSNLKESAKVSAENLRRSAQKESENLKQTAHIVTLNLMARTNIVVEHMKKTANDASDKLRESANVYSGSTAKNTYRSIEHLKSTIFLKKLQLQNKKQVILLVTVMIVVLIGGGIFYLNPSGVSNREYSGSLSHPLSTNYLIQNLRGDVVDTWISWKTPPDMPFHIHVLNSKYATKERLDAILDVIMSGQKIELDDSVTHKGTKGTNSTYYVGWYGALNSITTDTKFNIIKNLHFDIDEGTATGNIEIELTDLSNPDGYSGYTKSIVDEENHQILKSTITVYDINDLSTEDLKTLVRHELGHGFGLAHSTAPEDMMAPVITTSYPYISECDLSAISYLYDGGESSKVICKK